MYKINDFEDKMIPSMKPEALRKLVRDTFKWNAETEFAMEHLEIVEERNQKQKVVTS